MKSIQHFIEFILFRLLFAALRILPIDMASSIGGWLGRCIGPLFGAHKVANKNLQMAFPELDKKSREKLLSRIWDNLGRVAGELPHVPSGRLFARCTIHGAEHLTAYGSQVLFFSGHLGNWEVLPASLCYKGNKLTVVYRSANNPYVDKVINNIRITQTTSLAAKGVRGAVSLVRGIKGGHSIAMLVDQKMNDGISVPFFGRDAMTAPAIAEFALRYDLPIIPTRPVRKKGCHFDVFIYPPLEFEKTGDIKADSLVIMTKINALLESWIREYPEQWFWVHKRWPKA